MKQPKYDIFISYSRYGGRQYARIMCLLLRQKGYCVFQDIDCLIGTNWIEELKIALNNSKVYMVILTKDLLYSKYIVDGILKAKELNKPIIPVICDKQYPSEGTNSCPKSKEAYEILGNLQWSEIDFGIMLKPSFDYMEKTRVRKFVKPNLFKRLLYKIKYNLFI